MTPRAPFIRRRLSMCVMSPKTKLIRKEYGILVNGTWKKSHSGETFAVINPSNKEKLTVIARAKKADVDNAVKNSREAFEGKWKEAASAERGRLLNRVAKLLRNETDKLAAIETLDTGKPLSQAKAEVEEAARYFEYYAGVADKIQGESIPLKQNYVDYTTREPFGVSAHIIPWNYPVGMFGREVAPALAAGNTSVLKPAEEAPISALVIAEMALKAGLPSGVLNVVPGFGPEAGAALAGHPDVDCVTFTGSVTTGKTVMKLVANNVTPVSLELGGKSPMIVFPDADIEAAIENSMLGIFTNAGQVCSACSRLLLHDDISEKFLGRLVTKTQHLKVGPGIEDPDLGPIISEEQFNRVMEYISVGIDEGATLVTGGRAPDIPGLPDGYYVEPTIFDEVSNDMKIAKEEIFGPVLSVIRFETAEEALEIANNTHYGLVAGVFTSDLNIAHKFAKELNVGQVYVNEWFAGGVETPFGGYKESGFGRLKGLEALKHYTQLKNVCIKLT